MFKKRTVLVVGAGASAELDLPVADKLRGKISSLLNIRFHTLKGQISGDLGIVEAFNRIDARRSRLFCEAAGKIGDAMSTSAARSIDEFLETHAKNEEIVWAGKLAIVRAILESEADSAIKHEGIPAGPPKMSKAAGTWYPQFFNLIAEGRTAGDDLDNLFENLTIICFNYDRCIEHFLYYQIQTRFLCDEDRTASLISKLTILHPYGSVGALPWEKDSGGKGIMFGGHARPEQLIAAAHRIHTFSEQLEDQALDPIRKAVEDAEILGFLGFSFGHQNMRLLSPTRPSSVENVFATMRGIGDQEQSRVASQLFSMFCAGKTKTPSWGRSNECRNLFSEHYRGFTGIG